MTLETWIKTNATGIMLVIHIGLGMYLYGGDQTIMSWEIPVAAAFAALGISFYVFFKMKKEMNILESKKQENEQKTEEIEKREAVKRQQQYTPPSVADKPFEMEVEGGGVK